jgi:hypothetical protein
MPHVAMVPFTGFRVREREMLAPGMALPGLRDRAAAIGRLPALGLLTPPHWTCSYHEADHATEALADVKSWLPDSTHLTPQERENLNALLELAEGKPAPPKP